jgi:hypothetical protein
VLAAALLPAYAFATAEDVLAGIFPIGLYHRSVSLRDVIAVEAHCRSLHESSYSGIAVYVSPLHIGLCFLLFSSLCEFASPLRFESASLT